VSELDGFLAVVTSEVEPAERALHNGDAEPRIALWSSTEPVTLFGADYSAVGVDASYDVFRALAEQFSDCTAYEVEIVAAGASGDLAYTVAYERSSVTFRGVPGDNVLRVTQIYRLEDGQWRLVHRHGDRVLAGQLPANDDRS
jgi:ketosteroid isomerase-like protein